jgi:hypothetical protein
MRRRDVDFENRVSDTLRSVGDQTTAEPEDGFLEITQRLNNIERPAEVVATESRLPWLSAAALILLLVGGGLFFTIGSDLTTTGPSPVEQLAEAGEPVYFLPPADIDLGDGTTFYSTEPEDNSGSGIVIGRRIEDGFDMISLITLTSTEPDPIQPTVDFSVGDRTLTRERFEGTGVVSEKVGADSWIEYTVEDSAQLTDVVEATSIVGGELRFAPTGEREVLATISDLGAVAVSSLAHFRPPDDHTEPTDHDEPIGGLGFNLVTLSASQENALLSIGALGGVLTETTVDGHPGYILRFPEQSPESGDQVAGLVWTLPSGQAVGVISNVGGEAALREFAADLRPVDLETWVATLEDAGAQDFESLNAIAD